LSPSGEIKRRKKDKEIDLRSYSEFGTQRMLKIFSRTILLLVGLGFAGLGLAAGDPAAGKDQSIACAACHGQDGASGLDGTYPNLAGQNEKYLLHQLKLIQSGERPILLMTGQLTNKTEQSLADMAAYYASLPAKIGQATGSDEEIAKAQQIYRGGIASKNVAACSACHSPTGVGNAQAGFPRISGQSPEYTTVQLTAYRESRRSSDDYVGGMMRGVAHGLTDGEIAVLADYLQGLN
jgi:cytochrome c553